MNEFNKNVEVAIDDSSKSKRIDNKLNHKIIRMLKSLFPARKFKMKPYTPPRKSKHKKFEKRKDYILNHLEMLSIDSKITIISLNSGAFIALLYKLIPVKSIRNKKVSKIVNTYEYDSHGIAVDDYYKDIQKNEGLISNDPNS